MRRSNVFAWMTVMAVAGCASSGSTEMPAAMPSGGDVADAAPTASTIWDGVFTEAQADRGEALAEERCFTCHGQREWVNAAMFRTWVGPVTGLHAFLSQAMPADSPGSLSPQDYSDIVAYMLALNDAPAGAAELPTTQEELALIRIEPES